MATSLLTIDRTEQFSAVDFLGNDWSVIAQDKKSLELVVIEPSWMKLDSWVYPLSISAIGGTSSFPYDRIYPDAQMLQAFLRYPCRAPAIWKERVGKDVLHILFPGTIVRFDALQTLPLFVLSLYYDEGKGRFDSSRHNVDSSFLELPSVKMVTL